MPKDRSQQTPEEPEDWARLQKGRGQGTGGTGYDRIAGEQARPPLQDDDPADETIPTPETFDTGGDDTGGDEDTA